MYTLLTNPEIKLMTIETRLDRIQNSLRKALKNNDFNLVSHALKESRLALGTTRSVLQYHLPNRQKTLKAYGCNKKWETHVARQRS